MKLDLWFDWEKEEVFGKVFLILFFLFYFIDSVVLDVKDFEISKIVFEGIGKDLKFFYDKKYIVV